MKSNSNFTFTWNGEKVELLPLVVFLASVVALSLFLAVLVAIGLFMPLMIAIMCVAISLIPFHFVLRAIGRNGFFYWHRKDSGHGNVHVSCGFRFSAKAFQKRLQR